MVAMREEWRGLRRSIFSGRKTRRSLVAFRRLFVGRRSGSRRARWFAARRWKVQPKITEELDEISVQSRGFGILDVGYGSEDEAWAAGGSGILLRTTNGGKSWSSDKAADDIAPNLYSVKFINYNKGFVLGNDEVLFGYPG